MDAGRQNAGCRHPRGVGGSLSAAAACSVELYDSGVGQGGGLTTSSSLGRIVDLAQ
jgi:hypothetical protein